MKTTALCLIATLALGGSALAAERAPQGMPDAGIFAPLVMARAGDCVSMKTIMGVGGQIMPLKERSFRFLQGVFTAIPPVSHELPPGDRAVLAIGPHAETMGVLVDGEQACARFILPGFIIEMVAAIEAGDHAPPAKPGDGL